MDRKNKNIKMTRWWMAGFFFGVFLYSFPAESVVTGKFHSTTGKSIPGGQVTLFPIEIKPPVLPTQTASPSKKEPVPVADGKSIDDLFNTPVLDEITFQYEKSIADDIALSIMGFNKKRTNLSTGPIASPLDKTISPPVYELVSPRIRYRYNITGDGEEIEVKTIHRRPVIADLTKPHTFDFSKPPGPDESKSPEGEGPAVEKKPTLPLEKQWENAFREERVEEEIIRTFGKKQTNNDEMQTGTADGTISNDGTLSNYYQAYSSKKPETAFEPRGKVENKSPDPPFRVSSVWNAGPKHEGIQTGGPIIKDKIWFFGSYAYEDIHKRSKQPAEDLSWLRGQTKKKDFTPVTTTVAQNGTFEFPPVPDGNYLALGKGTCHEKAYQIVNVTNGQSAPLNLLANPKPVRVVLEFGRNEFAPPFMDLEYIKKKLAEKLAWTGVKPENIDSAGWRIIKGFDENSNAPAELQREIIEFQIGFKNFQPPPFQTSGLPVCGSEFVFTQTTGKDQHPVKPFGRFETDLSRVGQEEVKFIPDDPFYQSKGSWGQKLDDQWALKRIGFTPLSDKNSPWNLVGPLVAPVIVAVIDSGIDPTHPELAGKLWVNEKEIPGNGIDDDKNGYTDDIYGWNFVDDSNDLTDLNGHGTVNAGLIAASVNNGLGIAGINPRVKLMALKSLDFDLKGGSIDVSRAVYYAADNGARVINISIGGKQLSWLEQDAVDYARSKGALVVVAAGNEGIATREYSPAGLRNVLTVTATDPEDKRTNFSNWGQNISLAAPGVDILSLRAAGTDLLLLSGAKDYKAGQAIVGKDKGYYRVTGTSFAAPLVSGVASLILSKNPKLTSEQVERMILQSADDIEVPGWDQFTGYGLLNARKALGADPDYYTVARISTISPARKDGKLRIEVFGQAESSDFDQAWVEVGLGENPAEWKKAGKTIEKSMKEGLLMEFAPHVFTKRGEWSLRLIVKTKSHGMREARGSITID